MDNGKHDSIIRLINFFNDESKRCAKAGAHLAACVMLGSALESALLAMIGCDSELESKICKDKKVTSIYDLSLSALIDIARSYLWLPATYPRDTEIELEEMVESGSIGDFVEYAREIRNLVHPGKFMREYPYTMISSYHYEHVYDIVHSAFDFLYMHLIEELTGKV